MQKLYIHQAVSISAQGFWEGFCLSNLKEGLSEFKAFDPDYKTVIPVMALRRMSKITKMALMCGLTISKKSALDWDAIIVGTGLGNLADTEKFLNLISGSSTGLISPTAFTQSSHNTLSGQIALQLKNHGYNMTHVQRNFSFENGLKDAALQSHFGMKNFLLGAADEHIPLLDNLAREAGYKETDIKGFGEGASFFQLSVDIPSEIFVKDILIKMKTENPTGEIDSFLLKNQVDKKFCLLLTTADLISNFDIAQRSVAGLVGSYMTNSGIAMHLGCSYLAEKAYRHVLICTDSEAGLGLTLLGHE
ncbi:beta-ketoacyl synthase chain length factor [Algoriphagus sp. D3-2-R+10]|uniref:beta-ketoacyl synthase chain length factor n=1 Tax=Algoriphagus aurantiacus TaxID=3103948 RepID=UPI002B3771EF|nr:beta-ketoacyl synthase chain length factor [Algoriphagus sp. D3-2-R+10]MEB2777806.1 beta-ketoacyl synthase chain length factor [Algoriphagus sp. D3-2-R+10]